MEIDYDLDWLQSALTANDHSQLTEMFLHGFIENWNAADEDEEEESVVEDDDDEEITPPEDDEEITPPEDDDEVPLPPIDFYANPVPAPRNGKNNSTQWA